MAGKPEEPIVPGDQTGPVGESGPPPAAAPKPAKKPLAKSFHCTNCGAAVTVRYPGASMTAVCSGCSSIIDVTDENYKILTKYFKATRDYPLTLPLGSRGKLKGRTWEVIGFMVRADVASNYSWDEYLLFNPYYGYRWLTLDQGHWNLVATIKRKPEREGSAIATLDDNKFQIYNQGRAQVKYVIGEFYWRVVIGGQVTMIDYISPPQMLSMEQDDKEVVWSLGEYISPEEIKEAFHPPAGVPPPRGVSPTEPPVAKEKHTKMGRLLFVFWLFITCAQFYFTSTARNETALEFRGGFIPNSKLNDITTPVFVLNKDMANVAISLHAPVSNSWLYVSGELVNDDTGVSYPFEQTVEYYFGSDSDGYWSEGGVNSEQTFSSVPGGKYYINLDTESGDFKDILGQQFNLTVKRNVPTYDNYLWFCFFLSLMPLYSFMQMRKIEVARWSNSDFNPYLSQSS